MTSWRIVLRLSVYTLLLAYLMAFKYVFQTVLQIDQRWQQQKQPMLLTQPVILPRFFYDHQRTKKTESNTTTPDPKKRTESVLNAPAPKQFVPKIYQAGPWDLAPIVVEEYKLLFFTQGKVRQNKIIFLSSALFCSQILTYQFLSPFPRWLVQSLKSCFVV